MKNVLAAILFLCSVTQIYAQSSIDYHPAPATNIASFGTYITYGTDWYTVICEFAIVNPPVDDYVVNADIDGTPCDVQKISGSTYHFTIGVTPKVPHLLSVSLYIKNINYTQPLTGMNFSTVRGYSARFANNFDGGQINISGSTEIGPSMMLPNANVFVEKRVGPAATYTISGVNMQYGSTNYKRRWNRWEDALGTTVDMNISHSFSLSDDSKAFLGNYDLYVDAPGLNSIRSVNGQVGGSLYVEWRPVSPVDYYEVSRKVNNNSWQVVTTTTGFSWTDNEYCYVPSGQFAVSYRVRGIVGSVSSDYSNTESANAEDLGKKGETFDKPISYSLNQNYPNPFNPSTMISYAIPQDGNVSLKVYDMVGHEVADLVNGYKSAGHYSVQFDASKLSSGMYIYKIQAGEYSAVKKMQVLK